MSASPDLSSSSISSSGHIDGLGRRSLSFDRETGEMLERVHLQPELTAFESLIKTRVTRLSVFEDERFARPTSVERDPATGELTVLAEFITGSRLSDLLEATADAAIVPGVDVALGYLLDTLPALTLLHSTDGITHGLIDASRTVLTPDGQIVFLDPVFGSAVERLGLSRQRLWTKYGIASPAGDGHVRLDPAADIAQVALGAVALVLGRNLRPEEYPEALPSLLMEVIEVAQIRGSAAFASGLQRFLQRSLPLPGRRPYSSADEAVNDVRQLVRRDIGVDVCRQAVVDFATQMDTAFGTAPPDDAEGGTDRHAPGQSPRVPELDAVLGRSGHSAKATEVRSTGADHVGLTLDDHERTITAAADARADGTADEAANETELSLDNLDSDSPAAPARAVEEVYDLPPLDEVMARATLLSRPVPAPAPVYREPEAFKFVEPEPVSSPAFEDVNVPEPLDADHFPVQEVVEELVVPEPRVPVDVAPPYESPAAVEEAPPIPIAAAVEIAPPPVAPEPLPVEPTPLAALEITEAEAEAGPDKDSASSRRRKRQQQKSARARKDKLRSTTADQKTPPPPVPEPARPASPTGWLVSPQRAAQFEPPVPVPAPRPIVAPPPAPVRPAPVAVPSVPSFVPTPVGPLPQPVYPPSTSSSSGYGAPSASGYGAPSASGYGTPSAHQPAPPGPLAPPRVQAAPQPTAPVKIKVEAPSSFTTRRSAHTEAQPIHVPAERFGTLGLGHGNSVFDDEPRAFPWKLAAVAVVVAVVAIFLGRSYLPGRTAVSGEAGAAVETPAPASTLPPADADESPIPAGRGRIEVVTQPPGIRVLLDRKPVGETPLRIDVTPGRRILTFLTSGGEVIRSVRVSAGKTETLDIPVFSGWVAVFAPIVLQVAADGKSIGSTEQNRLMLPPGKHQLTVSNSELGYTATQVVEIEPGEVKTVNIDPRGIVNLNAIPWAEVWLDGLKLGDTPLAGTSVPLGLREFVFKNPQFGERKIGATIKAATNPAVVVDFTK